MRFTITKRKQTYTHIHTTILFHTKKEIRSVQRSSSPLYGEHQNVCVDRLDDDARPKHKDEQEAVFGQLLGVHKVDL